MDNDQAAARLDEEWNVIEKVDSQRVVATGRLSPRQRIAALCEPDSFFEIGALTRTQQSMVMESTPADGVITGYAKVAGWQVAIACEDPVVLARTDRQVAANKMTRLVANAVFRNMPFIYLVDGAAGPVPQFAAGEGGLFGGLSRQDPQPDICALQAPFISILMGHCGLESAAMTAHSDMLIAAQPEAESPEPCSDQNQVDVWVGNDLAAIELTKRFLSLIPRSLSGPLRESEGYEGPEAKLPDQLSKPVPRRVVLQGLMDRGSLIEFDPGSDATLSTGIASSSGYPIAFAATGGQEPAVLGISALRRMSRIVRLSRRFRVPLLTMQDCAGYEQQALSGADFLRELSALMGALRSSPAPKLSLVTGRGHVLGNFVLGSRRLGFDYIAAWPFADIDTSDIPGEQLNGAASADGPWLAAGIGIIDDVFAPSETRDRLRRMIEILSLSRSLPSLEASRKNRYVDDVPSV